MAQFAQLPDKSYVEFPDDWTEAQMDEAVYRDFADQFPAQEPGLIDKAKTAGVELLGQAKGVGSDILGSLSSILSPPAAAEVEDPDTFLSAVGKHAQNLPAVGEMTAGGVMAAQAQPLPVTKGVLAEGEKPGVGDAFKAIMSMLATGEGQTLMMEPFLGEDLQKARDVVATKGEEIAAEGSAKYKANQPVGLTGAAKMGSDTARAILEMAPAYTLAFLTKNPAMVPAVMGAQVKGRSYQESKEKGLADYEASARSNFNVFAEGLPEYIPALAILKKGGAASKIGWGALGEGAQEMVTEVLQNVYDARELEGLTLKDAIAGVDWGQVLYSGAVGVGAGGATGAVVSGAEVIGTKRAESKAEKEHEKLVDEALANIAEYQATQALSPDKGIDPKYTTQQPEDVGPAASGATAKAEELAQAQEAYTKAEAAEAAEKLGGKASGAQQLTEDQARDEQTKILADREKEVARKEVKIEADLAYKKKQDELEVQKEKDLGEAKVEQAKQDTRVQTRAAEVEKQQKEDIAKANEPADAQPTTMQQQFQKVLDEELIAELKKTLPEQKKLEHRPTIHLPGDKAEPVTLTHYSKAPGLTEIDPSFHGKGISGQESKRKAADPGNWVDRSYFFMDQADETHKDAMLGDEKYEIEFDPTKLYDAKADPDGLKEQSRFGPTLNLSLYEKNIKEAGYSGYWTDTPEQGKVVAMFEKTTVPQAEEPVAPEAEEIAPIAAEESVAAEGVEPRETLVREDTGRGTLHSNPFTAVARGWEDLAQKGIDKWNDAIGWLYGTLGKLENKELYNEKRGLLLGKIAQIDDIASDVYKTFRNTTQEQQRQIYTYLTTPDANPNNIDDAALRKKAISVKRLINRTGQKLVDMGLLSEAAFLKHTDGYLPIVYLKYLLGDKSVKQIQAGKKASTMSWGRTRDESIPEEVKRLILGEITDPAYLAAKGLGVELRDIAIIDFLNFISTQEDWVHQSSVVEWQGNTVSTIWMEQEARRIEQQAAYYTEENRKAALDIVAQMNEVLKEEETRTGDKIDSREYKQVPVNKRYGRLQGMYVRKEIYDDLIGSGQMMAADANFWESMFGYGGKGTKITQLWKFSKVAANPPAQLRNFTSNMIMLNLSGMRMDEVLAYIARAAREIKTDGHFWRIAKKHGVAESSFAAQELYRIDRDLLDLEARLSGPVSMATLKNIGGIVMEHAGDLYQLTEALGKTAKIMHAMEKQNKTAAEAAAEAQKWLFDYSSVPPLVRSARNMPLGIPFMTYYYKALPRLLETAIKKPWKYLPYVALPQLFLHWFAEVNDVDDEDAKQLTKALPKWIQDRGSALLMPYKDEAGRWQVLDFSYVLPWSLPVGTLTLLAEEEYGEALSSSGVFGGPIPNIVTAIATNTDPFTDQTIVNPGASPKEAMVSRLSYMYNLSMPGWLTSSGFAGKMLDAINEDLEANEEQGRTILTPGQATLRLFGANVYPFNPERSRAKNIQRIQKEIQEVKTNARRNRMDAASDVGDNEQEIQRINEDMVTRIEKLADKLETYAEGSEVPDALTLDR